MTSLESLGQGIPDRSSRKELLLRVVIPHGPSDSRFGRRKHGNRLCRAFRSRRILCDIRHIRSRTMAQGKSGRIVIEIDAELKRQLYVVLASRTMTLKDWFSQQARDVVADYRQPGLLPKRPAGEGHR